MKQTIWKHWIDFSGFSSLYLFFIIVMFVLIAMPGYLAPSSFLERLATILTYLLVFVILMLFFGGTKIVIKKRE